jgi:hypothetical protein
MTFFSRSILLIFLNLIFNTINLKDTFNTVEFWIEDITLNCLTFYFRKGSSPNISPDVSIVTT